MIFSTTYQPAVRCVGSERPGARALQDYLLAELDKLEGCSTVDSGIYNCRTIRGSSVRYSVHSEGRAGDTGVRLPNGQWPRKEIAEPGIRAMCDKLIDNASRLGVLYVIYAEQSRRPGERWQRYRGVSPHYDHIHWEISRTAAEVLTPEYVGQVLGLQTEDGGSSMTLTEYIELMFWNIQKRLPDQGGLMYWIDAFSNELPDQSGWSRNELAATTASRNMIYGLEHEDD